VPADKKGRSPGYLPQGYKKSTRTRQAGDGEAGDRALERQHWDGRQDARVAPHPIRARVSLTEAIEKARE
jgi:hypothetical protein